MKICCISDTHGAHETLEIEKYPADMIIHAGDFTKTTKAVHILEFLDWYNELPYKHKILIAGNHETKIEADPEWFKSILKEYPNITYLENEEVIIDGIKIFGSPYSNEFYNWAFMDYEPGLKKVWDLIPDDTNILVTHGPAYGVHDLVVHSMGRDPHVGSITLRDRIKDLPNLKLHVNGHIHEAYGMSENGNTVNVCPCIMTLRYEPVNEPIIVDLKE